jgi:hypothetical protein
MTIRSNKDYSLSIDFTINAYELKDIKWFLIQIDLFCLQDLAW